MRKYIFVTTTAFMLVVVGGSTSSANAVSDCNQRTDQDVRVRGCTNLIASGKLTKRDLSLAYSLRADAFREKNEWDRALSDVNTMLDLGIEADMVDHAAAGIILILNDAPMNVRRGPLGILVLEKLNKLRASSSRTNSQSGVAAVFEKHNLLGTFALDCKQPVGPHNHYIVHHKLGSGAVQRDLMVGPATKQYSYVIDRAEILRPGEVSTSMANEKQRLNIVFRFDDGRIRTIESVTPTGAKIVVGGNLTGGGGAAPWYAKCGS
jgi:hypothetical protein